MGQDDYDQNEIQERSHGSTGVEHCRSKMCGARQMFDIVGNRDNQLGGSQLNHEGDASRGLDEGVRSETRRGCRRDPRFGPLESAAGVGEADAIASSAR